MDDVKRSSPATDQEAETDEILALEEFLPYRLVVLAEEVSRSFSQIYAAEFGIGVPEWRVVALIGQCHQVTAKVVGERSTMHKTKVSRAVANLEKCGLVTRAPNPDDMRENFLTLTPKGQKMYADLVPKAPCLFQDADGRPRSGAAESAGGDHCAADPRIERFPDPWKIEFPTDRSADPTRINFNAELWLLSLRFLPIVTTGKAPGLRASRVWEKV